MDSTAVAIGASSCGSRLKWILLAVIRDTSKRSSTSRMSCRTCRSSTAGACRTRRRRAGLETLDGEPNRCERVSEFVRKRREKFVFTLIRFHELGGSVTNAELPVLDSGLRRGS